MANVLNRTTKQYILSVNTPDYPAIDWIRNPDLSAVAGFAAKYWNITGDTVTLMTPAERAAVDAAESSSRKDTIADELLQTETILRAFAEVVLDEINARSATITSILNAIDASANLGALKTAVALIADPPQRTLAQVRTSVRNKL